MKVKVSDLMAEIIADSGIHDVFTIVGGGAMHLNDSFGHSKRLKCYYNHHEQACAMAAESYARINNQMALVCVTTGPGGLNTLNGVAGAWLDSIPMLIVSGQVRYDTTARSTGLPLRAMGDQEFDITKAVSSMTKYCEMVTDPNKIKYCLQKAITLAKNGRPGPCWLDIPLNVQSAVVETNDLEEYDPSEYINSLPLSIDDDIVVSVLDKIKNSQRPVLYAGNGIRISGGYDAFIESIRKLNIPIVTNMDSVDLVTEADPLYVGRGGSLGNRAGNFAVQNSDLILSIGSRLSLRQTGFNWKKWAPHAYVIMEDVDEAELKKPTLHVDMPLCVDAKVFLESINRIAKGTIFNGPSWIRQCQDWKVRYPVVQKSQYASNKLNPYCFARELSIRLPENTVVVVSNGTACVTASQAYEFKSGQRFIANSGIASMGYGLPAAIGACVSIKENSVICIEGDGSLMMNLQELQTIVTNNLPIKLFLINNSGYHSIRLTQTNIFNSNYCGIGEQSHDLSFPSYKKIAEAFGLPYYSINSTDEISNIDNILSTEGFFLCEVFVDISQAFEPKSATKKLPDGSLYSPPLEDMAPFLDSDELKSNMYYND